MAEWDTDVAIYNVIASNEIHVKRPQLKLL